MWKTCFIGCILKLPDGRVLPSSLPSYEQSICQHLDLPTWGPSREENFRFLQEELWHLKVLVWKFSESLSSLLFLLHQLFPDLFLRTWISYWQQSGILPRELQANTIEFYLNFWSNLIFFSTKHKTNIFLHLITLCAQSFNLFCRKNSKWTDFKTNL